MKKKGSYESLELPIFIIFLTLSGRLKTSALNNCFTVGGVSTLGKYQPKFFNSSLNQFLEKELNQDEKMCLIAPEYFDSEICDLRIDLDNFLSNIQKLNCRRIHLVYLAPLI